ncbi:histidine phosphatase family protein [Acinetobacter equi]|uniref:Phosphoglycerate mutase n=1 Tax=Acinetobacter equi TaxID=1324350 RepID=A0A0N9VF12_9GAMM|nr:histidine phosphatase family protein [Acinetobacter equi]ALH96055.1 phosphoglycerate mutase [Acinetobacter equi]
MTTIYFIRHGQASFGAESYDKLSPKGEIQAKILGEYLHKILKEEPYIVAGSMHRHQQTATISLNECFPHAKIHTNSAWNEFNHQQVFAKYDELFAQPQVLKKLVSQQDDPYQYLSDTFAHAIERWTSNEYSDEYDESWPQFKLRVENALQNLCDELTKIKPRYAVVYTSGGVISVLAGKVLELDIPKTFSLTWAIANASLTTCRLIHDEPQILSLNEHHYLKVEDPELLTWI